MNPFRESIDNKNSFNIGLRKAALRKTGVFLLIILEKGCVKFYKFTQECIDQPKRSENKTKRNKLLTFAREDKSKRLRSDNKVALVQMVQDLFRSIIFCHCKLA